MKYRHRQFVLGLAATLVPAFLIGCGGGGGGSSSPKATATPVPTPLANGCDTSDFTPNYVSSLGGLQQWSGFPLRVYLPPTDARTKALTIRGFDQWVSATGNRVRYTVVDSASNADITVTFGIYSGGDKLGVTSTYYYAGQNRIQRAEIAFSYYAFNSRSDAEELNQSVAAHEFGHALGISGHSPSRNDLMYPVILSGEEDITSSDLNTLRTVYCDNFPTRSAAAARQQSGVLLKRVIS